MKKLIIYYFFKGDYEEVCRILNVYRVDVMKFVFVFIIGGYYLIEGNYYVYLDNLVEVELFYWKVVEFFF